MSYKDRLELLMTEKGVTRTQLAAALGVTYQAVRKVFETSGALGSKNNLKAAAFFDVSPKWLATGLGNKDQITSDTDMKLSPQAHELGMLYDMINSSERIKRAKAFSLAQAAIVGVLEGHEIVLQVGDPKTPPQ